MPIHCPLELGPVPDHGFETIDRLVMGCCFASQNTLGRLCDEKVYENDVAARLLSEGLAEVRPQVPVTLTHSNFKKTYRLDLVIEGIIYELKTVAEFSPEHEAQGIHYAALTGVDRVKLINFRSEKVTSKLLRSPLWRVDRRKFTVGAERWQALSDECPVLMMRMSSLLSDWGTFLEARVYEEFLAHASGGEMECVKKLPVTRDGVELGTHRVICHSGQVGMVVTALASSASAHEWQLHRLLNSLPLRGIQWININHADVQFVTLTKGKGMGAKP